MLELAKTSTCRQRRSLILPSTYPECLVGDPTRDLDPNSSLNEFNPANSIDADVLALPLNLKKLQSYARRRLELRGSVDFKMVAKGRLSGLLSTTSSSTKHTIFYSNAESLQPVDIFHEICRAKINELGFTAIENAALTAMRDCSNGDAKYIRDANSSNVIVLETYANTLLFSHFEEESRNRREGMIGRFQSSDALTTLHTQMGFWGTAGVSYHREACLRSSLTFPDELIERAIQRANGGDDIKKEYDVVNSLLSDLPHILLENKNERISDEDSIRTIDVIMRLFAAKTGLKC
jgi:hypothetical protein